MQLFLIISSLYAGTLTIEGLFNSNGEQYEYSYKDPSSPINGNFKNLTEDVSNIVAKMYSGKGHYAYGGLIDKSKTFTGQVVYGALADATSKIAEKQEEFGRKFENNPNYISAGGVAPIIYGGPTKSEKDSMRYLLRATLSDRKLSDPLKSGGEELVSLLSSPASIDLVRQAISMCAPKLMPPLVDMNPVDPACVKMIKGYTFNPYAFPKKNVPPTTANTGNPASLIIAAEKKDEGKESTKVNASTEKKADDPSKDPANPSESSKDKSDKSF